MKRKIAAILAADVAGYSRLVAEDEEGTLRRLASHREVFDDFVQRYGGRIFNTAGDSAMCEFDSAVEAVRAAIDIQESLRTRNRADPPGRRVQFRIGITIGDVVERGTDLLGDGVNIASRLESLAEPGGICVSRSVHEAVANKVSVPFRDIGQRRVKNLQPVHAFAVGPGELHDVSGERPKGFVARWRRAALPWLAGSGAVLATVGFIMFGPQRAPKPAPQQISEGTAPPAATAPAPTDPADTFARLTQQGGILADAKTAPELYHNARIYEARGDAAAARRAYHALALLGLELVDPHLRYSALLGVQNGRAGARQAYSDLMTAAPARIVSFMHALQFEGAERRAAIEALAAAHPDYPPAHYFMAEEYAEDRIGSQTLTERRLEHEALERFLDAEAAGTLSPFFLDHSVLAQWLDRARRRKAASEAFFQTAKTRPTASFVRSNTSWIASLHIPEAATDISYRVSESGEFKSTGLSQAIDSRTGRAAPVPSFELPVDQEATPIYITYDDPKGRKAGPFVIHFDPKVALPAGQRDILERMPGSWVAFQPGSTLLYYTTLVSYRCAIESALIGYDGGALDKELPLPACNESNPHAVPPGSNVYVAIPRSVQAVSVQLIYVDGTKSEVKSFRR